MTDYKVADIALADRGRLMIQLAEHEMKGLVDLRKKHSEAKVLKGVRIAGCTHITSETAVLIESLVECGAEVRWCASDALTTCDQAAAAIANAGVTIFAWKSETKDEFEWCKQQAVTFKDGGPHMLLDYGGILTSYMQEKLPDQLKEIKGIVEHISIAKYYKLLKESSFKGPVFNCIESKSRKYIEDFFGMRESSIDAIKRATHVQIAGKCAVVCGYGDVGIGIAHALKSLGAHVIVTEIDPVAALHAALSGFEVSPLDSCIDRADIVITSTGGSKVVDGDKILKMKDHAILANMGYLDDEIDIDSIHKKAKSHESIKPHVEKYTFESGKSIILLAQGSLAPLSLGEGYSSFVMSISFSVTFLSTIELQSGTQYLPGFIFLPRKLDEEICEAHLTAMGGKLDKLTEEQAKDRGITAEVPLKHYPHTYQ